MSGGGGDGEVRVYRTHIFWIWISSHIHHSVQTCHANCSAYTYKVSCRDTAVQYSLIICSAYGPYMDRSGPRSAPH